MASPARRHWYQARPSDDLNDIALRKCSIAARGAFYELRNFIRLQCEPGRLAINGVAVSLGDVAFMCHVELSDLEGLVTELLEKNVARKGPSGVLELPRELDLNEEFQRSQTVGKTGGRPPKNPRPNPPHNPQDNPLFSDEKPPVSVSLSDSGNPTRARTRGSGSGSGSGSGLEGGVGETAAERTPSPRPSPPVGEREAVDAEVPSLEEAEAFGAAWPGDLARGIAPGIPQSTVLGWHNYRAQRGWRGDWRSDLVAWHRRGVVRAREQGQKIAPDKSVAELEARLAEASSPAEREGLRQKLAQLRKMSGRPD